MMTVDLLRRVRALVEEAHVQGPQYWTCRDVVRAVDANGRPCSPTSERAQAWSLLGALMAASGSDAPHEANKAAYDYLRRATGGMLLDHWNDETGRTKEDVLRAIDRAISAAAREAKTP